MSSQYITSSTARRVAGTGLVIAAVGIPIQIGAAPWLPRRLAPGPRHARGTFHARSAVAAALRAPGRVGGLVFLDGHGLDTGAGAGAGDLQRVLPNPYRTTLLRLAVRSDWVIRQIYGSQCGPVSPRLDGAGVDQWRRPLQVTGAEHALWSMQGIVGLPAAWLAALTRVAVSKKVAFGAQDDVFSRSSPYDTTKLIGAPAPTIIPGARHLSFISHPDQVAAAIITLR